MTDNFENPQVFNRLCHLAALSKEGKLKSAVDNLVLTIFAINKDLKPKGASEVAQAISNGYNGLSLKEDAIQSSLDSHLSGGRLTRNRSTKTLELPPQVRVEIESEITSANELERRVRDEWSNSLDSKGSFTGAVKNQLWNALSAYMATSFKRHGAETVLLLDPSHPVNESLPRMQKKRSRKIVRTSTMRRPSISLSTFLPSPRLSGFDTSHNY
jgi:hypothetical protein